MATELNPLPLRDLLFLRRRMLWHFSLWGVPNRDQIADMAVNAIRHAEVGDTGFAVIFPDGSVLTAGGFVDRYGLGEYLLSAVEWKRLNEAITTGQEVNHGT